MIYFTPHFRLLIAYLTQSEIHLDYSDLIVYILFSLFQAFDNRSDLRFHSKNEHRNVDKGHPCPICFKSFVSEQQLRQHDLVHSNERKYQCQYCDRTFKQLSHVQQHTRRHTGKCSSTFHHQGYLYFTISFTPTSASTNASTATEHSNSYLMSNSVPDVTQVNIVPFYTTRGPWTSFCRLLLTEHSNSCHVSDSTLDVTGKCSSTFNHQGGGGCKNFFWFTLLGASTNASTATEHSNSYLMSNSTPRITQISVVPLSTTRGSVPFFLFTPMSASTNASTVTEHSNSYHMYHSTPGVTQVSVVPLSTTRRTFTLFSYLRHMCGATFNAGKKLRVVHSFTTRGTSY